MAAVSETKICRRCGRRLPLAVFTGDRRAKDGKRNSCRECDNERARERYAAKVGRGYRPRVGVRYGVPLDRSRIIGPPRTPTTVAELFAGRG